MAKRKNTREIQFKKFLKERKLTSSFRKFQKIKKKRNFEVVVDGERKFLTAYKKGNKTIIADRLSLRTLATTKKFNLTNVMSGFKSKKITSKFGGKIIKKQTTPIKLKEVRREVLKNFSLVEKSNPIRKRVGQIYISVTFWKGKEESPTAKQTVEGGSRKQRQLINNRNKRIAFDEAIKGAWSQVRFSPDGYRVNYIHYAYYINRSRQERL